MALSYLHGENILKSKNQTFSTLGHHHSDSDLVFKMLGFTFQSLI